MPVAVMLDPNVLTDLEQLTLCSYCNQKYNDGEQCPKFLSCKHLFCLRCIESNLLKGRELLCVHCWKRTELQGELGPAEALPTYAPLLALVNNFSLLKLSSSSSSAAAAVTVGGAPNSILPGSGSSAAVAAANCKTTNHHDPCAPTTKERKSENCHTHGMPLALWCATCSSSLCRACATQEHSGHQVKSQIDAKEQLVSDVQLELAAMGKLSSEIQRLQMQQRDFLIKVLEACVTLKTHVETDLQNGWSHFPEISDARETLGKAKTSLRLSEGPADIYTLRAELVLEKERLQTKYQEMMLQCQLDDLIGNSGVVFNFDLLKQAVAGIHSGEPLVVPQLNPPPLATNGLGHPGAARLNHPHHQQHHHLAAASQNPILFLANYCMSQLYRRHVISKQQHHLQQNGSVEYHHPGQPIVQLPSVHVASVAASQPPPQQQQPQPPQQQQQQQQPQVQQQVGAQVPQQPQPQPGQPQQQPQQGQQLLMVPPGSPSMIKQPGGAMLQASAANFMSVSDSGGVVSLAPQSRVVGPSASCPRYYFNIEVNNTPHGRIVIEVRPDMAPKMAKNFSVLATGEIGVGYKGCTIFQCWEGESVITGDFELNNGRGGRSIYEDGYFMPDDTKFPAVRGAVGMRRTQKRHDNLGMVGSQFRIILQDMRGFTGIFGHVVEGLELVEKISTYGDQTGKPTKTILITKCGKL